MSANRTRRPLLSLHEERTALAQGVWTRTAACCAGSIPSLQLPTSLFSQMWLFILLLTWRKWNSVSDTGGKERPRQRGVFGACGAHRVFPLSRPVLLQEAQESGSQTSRRACGRLFPSVRIREPSPSQADPRVRPHQRVSVGLDPSLIGGHPRLRGWIWGYSGGSEQVTKFKE